MVLTYIVDDGINPSLLTGYGKTKQSLQPGSKLINAHGFGITYGCDVWVISACQGLTTLLNVQHFYGITGAVNRLKYLNTINRMMVHS